jgi:hypothetical protein
MVKTDDSGAKISKDHILDLLYIVDAVIHKAIYRRGQKGTLT